MSAADGFLTPSGGAARAELERRYRRLLRLYPREFRARRAEEMLGVLMASAAEGQSRPARGDVSDVVRGSLAMRLRGPRGGWPFPLAAFALVAPLFLVLTDILQVAFPYWESPADMRSRVSFQQAHLMPGASIPQSVLARQHVGGLPLLSQPVFLLLVAGHLVVATAVINGRRRTALVAAVTALAVDAAEWGRLQAFQPGAGTLAVLSIGVFLFEVAALAGADPRAARRREGWEHVVPALVLAIAVQAWALAFDRSSVAVNGGSVPVPTGGTLLAVGFALAGLAVLLPLPLGLGWRTSLLLAAACYPLFFLGAADGSPFSPPMGRLAQQVLGPTPPAAAHAGILAVLFLPPLLVLGWAVAAAIRTGRPRDRGDLAA
jgi:hypothetical protein